jgi:hypothetical protein
LGRGRLSQLVPDRPPGDAVQGAGKSGRANCSTIDVCERHFSRCALLASGAPGGEVTMRATLETLIDRIAIPAAILLTASTVALWVYLLAQL